jgi:tetratricopeptide (TPR) repeat protein
MFLYLLVFFISRWEHVLCVLWVFLAMAFFQACLGAVQSWRGALRPSGTFFNPNFLAGYLVIAWVLVLSYLVFQPVQRMLTLLRAKQVMSFSLLPRYLLALCAFAVLGVAILETASRGALVAAAVGASIVIGGRFGAHRAAILLGCGLAGVLLIPNPLQERIFSEHASNPVTYARWEMWGSAMRIVMEHPLGIGLGLYQYVFPQYAFPVESQIARYGTVAQTPHSEYLQVAVELGLPGLLIVGWGLYQVGRQIRAGLDQRLRRLHRLVVVGASGAVGSLVAHAAIDSNLHEPALALALAACVAVLMASTALSRNAVDVRPAVPPAYRTAWTTFALVLLALTTLFVVRLGVAWTYYEKGNELNRAGDLVGAANHYDSAVELDPGKSLYHSALAAAWFRQFERSQDLKQVTAAIEQLNEAFRLNPLDGRLAGLLGKVYTRLSSVPDLRRNERRAALLSAEKAYERATMLEPFNAAHHWELGQVYLELENVRAGEVSIKRAAELEPNFLRAREWIARLHLGRGELSRAQAEFTEIKERQERYRQFATSLLEKEFLVADSEALGAAISRARGGT